MSTLIDFWFFIAALNLCILTYQDYKNKMLVDDRINSFLYGLTLALPVYLHKQFLFIILLFALTLCLRWIFLKFMVLGEADINALNWIFFGLGIVNIYTLTWFTGIFIFITALYYFFKWSLFKIPAKTETPYFIVILLAFLITWIWFTPFFSWTFF